MIQGCVNLRTGDICLVVRTSFIHVWVNCESVADTQSSAPPDLHDALISRLGSCSAMSHLQSSGDYHNLERVFADIQICYPCD
jgi:hypothetical protein